MKGKTMALINRICVLTKNFSARKPQNKSSNVLNLTMVVGALTLLALLALYVRVGATVDSVAVLKTTGMTCSSCSNRITAALQEIKGVAVAEVDVEGGWVIVGYDTKTVKPETLSEKVNGTGFVSGIHQILTPEQFKQITGRDIGNNAARNSGCCGGKGGGCNSRKQS
jgi:periplasmic mercuric ion binding protein